MRSRPAPLSLDLDLAFRRALDFASTHLQPSTTSTPKSTIPLPLESLLDIVVAGCLPPRRRRSILATSPYLSHSRLNLLQILFGFAVDPDLILIRSKSKLQPSDPDLFSLRLHLTRKQPDRTAIIIGLKSISVQVYSAYLVFETFRSHSKANSSHF